jgi:hypothetical protein
MAKTSALLVPAVAAFASMTAMATDIPTPELQNIMKSNAAIVDLVGANNALGRDTNIETKDGAAAPAIRAHLKAKDFDALIKDAATLRDNFVKIEAFWAARQTADAVMLTKTALKQVGDIEAAAKAQDVAAVTKAEAALANTCRDCHLAHRVVMLTEQAFAIK